MSDKPDSRSKAQQHFAASQVRDDAVKKEIAAERAKSDAKTAKLRALRLAKEEADREELKNNPPPAAARKTRARKAKTATASS